MIRLLLATAFTTLATAQAITVDYPDSTLGSPAGQYPIYTGTATNVIRGQLFCPSTFAGLPTTPMVCTRVGVQLAEVTGPVTYAQFVVRVGSSNVGALTNTWATNLPDQRIQVDLSNQLVSGGGIGVNQWVEWPLAAPFVYTPGEDVVLDITSQSSVAGQYLRTAIGTGVPRMISTNYGGGPTGGTPLASGGIKFRLVFEPGGFVVAGPGCPGSGNFVPAIDAIGQPTIGNPGFVLLLNNALGGTLCALLLGFPADVDIGGGCRVRSDGLVFQLFGTNGVGPGTGTAGFGFPIPNQPWLAGTVLDAQWGVLDMASASPLGITTSSNAKLVLQ
jgi:hypothetical protein